MRRLAVMLALASPLAWGCVSAPRPVDDDALMQPVGPVGDGYLADGPTTHLINAKNERYTTPIQALERRDRQLEEARESIRALEDRILRLMQECRNKDTKRIELEAALEDSRQDVARGKRVRTEMAETLARLQIRGVQLEQELFNLKRELLKPVADGDVETEGDQ